MRKSPTFPRGKPNYAGSPQPIIALEKRIAFDGAAAATVAKTVRHAMPGDYSADRGDTSVARSTAAPRDHAGVFSHHSSTDGDASARNGSVMSGIVSSGALRDGGAADARASAQPTSVVFIESDVPDIGTLIKDIDHSAQIVILDSSKDGVDAIAGYLAAHKGVQDVYIFSHGSDASLNLGSATLDSASMQGQYAADLAIIKSSLAPDANILVYGCDFAQGAAGDAAARLLSQLTGASVAASTDLTGGTAEGGDFILEDKIGAITAPDVLSSSIAADYDGLLATQSTGAFTTTTGTSGSATSSTTVATATTADGSVKIVVTITPNANNSANSLTTTTSGASFDTTSPASAHTTSVNGNAALEETLLFGGTTGGSDGANSATITIAYFDAKTGAPISVTNPIIDIDRLGGSSSNGNGSLMSNSSDLSLTTQGASLTELAGSSSAFNVTSSDIYETVGTSVANNFSADASSDPTKGTAAGTVQVNGTYSTLTFNWAKASGSLNGGDRIDLIFSADTSMAQNGSLPNASYTDGQAGVSIATAQAFTDPSGLAITYSASGLPAGLSIDASTGQITGTIDHDASANAPATSGSGATLDGTYTVIVTATNDANNFATQTFTIDSKNTAPTLGTGTANQTNNDGDTVAALDASHAFSDPNGDPLTFTATGLPAGLSISSAGLITGTVAKDAAVGVDTVMVGASDDKGATASESFTWTIKDVPPAKSGTLPNQVVTDGQAGIAIATAQGFSDSIGNSLTYVASGLPSGLSINPTTGEITGTIDHDASKIAPATSGSGATLDGTYSILVTASDGLGGTADQTFTIDSKNSAPVVGTKTANQTNSDGATIAALNAAAAFSDPNGDPLTYASTGLPPGLSISSTGVIAGTVAKNATPGSYAVAVTATDDKGASTKETFTWLINDVPPATNSSLPNQVVADGQSGISIATAQGFADANGNALTYSASGLPAGLSINATTGQITGTIDHDASKNAPTTSGAGATLDGTYTIIVTASDGLGGSAKQTFAIDSKNSAPVVGTKTANQTNSDGDTIAALNAAAAFSDPNGDPLTYTGSNLPAGLSISTAGLITGTVAKNATPGTYMVGVTATDDKGATTTESFSWIIKDVPPTTSGTLANQTYTDGQSGVAISTSQAFKPSNGNALTYSASGLPAGLTINASTGAITGTVNHDASKNAPTTTGSGATLDGTYTVVVTASDGLGGIANQSFTINSSNTAPVVGTNTANQTSNDGATITAVNASQAFSDPNGDPLTFTASNLPSGLTLNASTGVISGKVAANAAPGTTTVRVVATDDKGAATREVFTWTINDVPPSASGTLANHTYPDSTANISIATAGGFNNPNGLALTYTATGLPKGLSIDPATGLVTGQLDHDASANAPQTSGSGATLDGTYAVTITVSDGQGGTATQAFKIDATNQAPTLVAQTPDQHGADGQTVSLDGAKPFTDPNVGDAVTYTATGLPTGLSINAATGLISGIIDPHASIQGPFTVIVTATDDKGAATSETFKWTVDDVPPMATPALPAQSAYDGTNVSYVTESGFTNPNAVAYTYTASGLPAGLSINVNTGVISGTLDHDASIGGSGGVYAIAVTANDGQGGTATNSFDLTASNQAPVVGVKTANQTNSDGAAVSGVDASKAFSDPNGDPLTYSASNLPVGLSINASTGLISGTVAVNATAGVYSVAVTATDDKSASTSETFTWTIGAAPPQVAATLAAQSAGDGTPGISIATSQGFSDKNGNPLTYSATGLPAGLSIDPVTGIISGTLNHDASENAPVVKGAGATLDGTYAITVTVSDGLGGTASQNFAFDATNAAPTVATATAAQTNTEGDAVSLNAGKVFTDPNAGDVLIFAASGLPAGLTIDPKTGLVTGMVQSGDYSPKAYQVTVTATDDKGAATSETFAWTIRAAAPNVASAIPNASSFDGTPLTIDTASHFASSIAVVYSASGLPKGLSIDPLTGIISGTVDSLASKNGPSPTGSGATLDSVYTVVVTATNGTGPTSQSFALDVANQAPVVGTATANQANKDGDAISTVDVSQAFSDPNGDPLTYAASNLPSGLTIDPSSGKITGTIAGNAMPGAYAVSVTATDDKGAATTETFVWTVTDAPPVATGMIAAQSYVDGQSGISIAASTGFTVTNDNQLMYSASGLPAGLSINAATGAITGTIDHDASAMAPQQSGAGATLDGTYTVVVTASDGLGGTATQSFTIGTANTAPMVGMKTVDQHGQDGQTVSIDAAPPFSDLNGDPLTFSAANLPKGLTIDPAKGLITGTIDKTASAGGPYSVTVTATDDKGAATSESFTYAVDDVAPQATPPLPARSINDGTAVAYATVGGFTNPNGLALAYSATGLPKGLTINPTTGLISGTLDDKASVATSGGLYTVAVTVDDGQGGTATNTFVFTASNQAPVVGTPTLDKANLDGDTITPVDTSKVFSDPNSGDTLTYSASNLPKGLTIDPATGIISGMVSGTALPGGYYVTVTATDEKGAATPETFTWTIGDVAPVVTAAIPNQTYNDGQGGIAIAAGTTFESPTGVPLTFTATGMPHGLTIDPTSGLISGYVGHDSSLNAPVKTGSGATLDGTYTVVVTASDGQGGVVQQSFTISATNQAPVVGMPTAAQQSADGQVVTLDVAKPFADPNTGDVLTFAATGLPTGLTINPTTGLISGTIDPRASASAPYAVEVTATDEKGASTRETFSWAVSDVSPVAGAPFTTATIPDGTTIVPIDTASHFASPNGLPLSYSAIGLPKGLGIDPVTGLISGTLDHDASAAVIGGVYTATISASDGQGGVEQQSFTIDATNQAPVIGQPTPDQTNLDGDKIVPVDTSKAFSDPNAGDTLTYSASNLPKGLAIDPLTGAIYGTVDKATVPGAYVVAVTATDDKGAATVETFTWMIGDVSPVATGALPNQTYTDGQSGIALDTGGAFASPTGLTLTYTATGLPHGLTIDPATGQISGTLDPDASAAAPVRTGSGAMLEGTYAVTVTATDEFGGTVARTFAIDVDHLAPTLAAQTPDQHGRAGDVIAPLDLSAAFADAAGNALTYAATGLPPGLSLDPTTGRLGGTLDPSIATATSYRVTVTATDANGASVSETFLYAVDAKPTSNLPTPSILQPQSFAEPVAALPSPSPPQAVPESSLQVEAATPVLDAINQITGGEEKSQVISAKGIVISTVNGVAPLNGLQNLDVPEAGIVRSGAATNEEGDRYERTQSGLGRGIEELATPLNFLGASSIDETAGHLADGTAINIETVVRDRVLAIGIENGSTGMSAEPLVSIDVTLADGRRLPSWLQMEGKGFLVGKVPGGVETIDLRITTTLRSGTTSQRTVRIRTDRGTIMPRASL